MAALVEQGPGRLLCPNRLGRGVRGGEADITGLPSTSEAAGNGVVELAMAVLWPWRRACAVRVRRTAFRRHRCPVRAAAGRVRVCAHEAQNGDERRDLAAS